MITFVDDLTLPVSYVNSVDVPSAPSAPLQGGALDKKTMIIAAVVVVAIITAVLLYFFVFKSDDDDASTTGLKAKSKTAKADDETVVAAVAAPVADVVSEAASAEAVSAEVATAAVAAEETVAAVEVGESVVDIQPVATAAGEDAAVESVDAAVVSEDAAVEVKTADDEEKSTVFAAKSAFRNKKASPALPVFSTLSLKENVTEDVAAQDPETSHDSLMRKYSFESFREAMVNGSPKSILVGDNDCEDCEEFDPSWRATGHTRAAYERHVQPLQRTLRQSDDDDFTSS